MKTLLLALLPTLAIPSAQEPGQADASGVIVSSYLPSSLDPQELINLAYDFYGPTQDLASLSAISGRVLLGGTPSQVSATQRVLEELERAMQADRSPEDDVMQVEYRPRFLRAQSAYELLKGYGRNVSWRGTRTRNVDLVEEQGLVLLRDTPERIAEMQQELVRLDQPPLQVRLRLRLFVASPGDKVEPAAADTPQGQIERSIGAMIGVSGLRQIGTGVLTTSVTSEPQLRVRLGSWMGDSYELQLTPVAFDEKGGTLTTRTCSLSATRDEDERKVFSTAAVLRGNETTVLGATGSTPVFVAIDVERLR